ncbi:MAG: nucleotidyltransferase substrate binding protein [Rikenellaceae bacterium]
MENINDIRWEQRFSNYRKALNKLKVATELISHIYENLSVKSISDEEELQIEGLIQRFEYTHELAWKVMMDYAKYQGFQDIKGSRDATRYALKSNLISDECWMEMIQSRNRTSHTYDDNTAQEILIYIAEKYLPAFIQFESKMREIQKIDRAHDIFDVI